MEWVDGAQIPREINCFQMGSAQQKWTDRWTGRQVGEESRQTWGKQEAEGKAVCALARLAALHALKNSSRVSFITVCPAPTPMPAVWWVL